MYGHFTERHGLTITGDRKPFYTKHMRRRAWLMQAFDKAIKEAGGKND